MVVLTIGSFIGFAIFLIMIQLGTMQRWEEAFALQIIQSRTPSLTRMMHFFYQFRKSLSDSCDRFTVVCLSIIAGGSCTKTAVSIFIVSAAAYLIKRIVRRDRPIDHRLVEEKDHSFPSAHAATSAAMYGTIALNLGILVPTAVLPMTLLAILLSFMIGFSRVYLGIHFLTDVIGGWLLGTGVAGLVTFTDEYLMLISNKKEQLRLEAVLFYSSECNERIISSILFPYCTDSSSSNWISGTL